jgi:hypothetical protein
LTRQTAAAHLPKVSVSFPSKEEEEEEVKEEAMDSSPFGFPCT